MAIEKMIDLQGQALINYNAQAYLNNTDWMTNRHRDQLDAGLETTLTDSEYKELLQQRQEARDSIIL